MIIVFLRQLKRYQQPQQCLIKAHNSFLKLHYAIIKQLIMPFAATGSKARKLSYSDHLFCINYKKKKKTRFCHPMMTDVAFGKLLA